jgi:hypothetical protein
VVSVKAQAAFFLVRPPMRPLRWFLPRAQIR